MLVECAPSSTELVGSLLCLLHLKIPEAHDFIFHMHQNLCNSFLETLEILSAKCKKYLRNLFYRG